KSAGSDQKPWRGFLSIFRGNCGRCDSTLSREKLLPHAAGVNSSSQKKRVVFTYDLLPCKFCKPVWGRFMVILLGSGFAASLHDCLRQTCRVFRPNQAHGWMFTINLPHCSRTIEGHYRFPERQCLK